MITDTDVKKLKKVFTTKDDLNKFATKDDLKKLATKKWTLENFATKGEMYLIRDELKSDISEVKELVKKTFNAVDKFSGRVSTLEQENKMGAVTARRHGIHIQELAKATGTTLST